jgi:hypothetical protein
MLERDFAQRPILQCCLSARGGHVLGGGSENRVLRGVYGSERENGDHCVGRSFTVI